MFKNERPCKMLPPHVSHSQPKVHLLIKGFCINMHLAIIVFNFINQVNISTYCLLEIELIKFKTNEYNTLMIILQVNTYNI